MSATVDVTSALREKFPSATPRASLDHEAVNVPAAAVPAVLQTLRDTFAFDLLTDLTAIDWAEGATPRFTVVYHLYSTTRHTYVRIAADCVNDLEPTMPSVVGLWAGANWHERECFDMFGIRFEGHPDLRRLLTDYGFQGHPLRKDFPMTGYVEVRYDEEQKRVVYEPVKLTQEFRNFDFLSPWEGAEYATTVLPGDEKAGSKA